MFLALLCIGYIPFVVNANDCTPTFDVEPNKTTESERPISLECSVRHNNPCRQGVEYVIFQKTFENIMIPVFQIYSQSNYTAFNISNGYTLMGRIGTPRVQYGEYRITINATIIEDTGEWMCKLKMSGKDDLFYSPREHLLVATRLTSDEIYIEIPPYILLGSPSTYVCHSTRVHPKPSIHWQINGDDDDGTPENTENGIAWDMKNTIYYTFMNRDEMDVKCIFRREDLSNSVESDADDVDEINAPATVENSTVSHKTPSLTNNLTFICIASGTGVKIEWYHNYDLLRPNLYEETFNTINGTYAYGETTANKSTLVWNKPEGSTCENVDVHNGLYECKAKANMGGEDVDTNQLNVDVEYAPLAKSEREGKVNVTVGDSAKLEFKTCSNPQGRYTWTSKDGYHDLSGQGEDIIQFTVNNNDTIICNVTNIHGYEAATFSILAIELPTTTAKPPTPPPTTDNSTVEDTNEPPLNEALIIANAVIWSLCGVVAIVLVCLALYHYRQIQNGKKYRGEYSEETILTDDEVSPGTSRDTGAYDDIDTTVVKQGAVNLPVSGLGSAEGLYAEVKSPGKASTVQQQQRKHESPNKSAACKPNSNTAKPSVPIKPNVQSIRVSRTSISGGYPSSGVNPTGAPYDNAEVNLYANCEQRPIPKNGDGTITYADLALQKEDPYDEGAPPVPVKNTNDQEPVQYASIKRNN